MSKNLVIELCFWLAKTIVINECIFCQNRPHANPHTIADVLDVCPHLHVEHAVYVFTRGQLTCNAVLINHVLKYSQMRCNASPLIIVRTLHCAKDGKQYIANGASAQIPNISSNLYMLFCIALNILSSSGVTLRTPNPK